MHFIDLERVEAVVLPVAEGAGYELVACDWLMEEGRRILRVYIDKPGGISLGDCERLSHLLGPVLEVEDLIPRQYNLEISSPGLDRPLRKQSDFERFAGETLRLQTKIPLENRSRFKGKLKGIEGEWVVMEVDGTVYRIPFKEVYKARLEVDYKALLKKKK